MKTLAQIAAECGVLFHVAKYATARHGIEPTTRVGVIRVYDAKRVEQVKDAIRRTARGR